MHLHELQSAAKRPAGVYADHDHDRLTDHDHDLRLRRDLAAGWMHLGLRLGGVAGGRWLALGKNQRRLPERLSV